MYTFTIEIAGCTVSVDAMFETTKFFCADYPSDASSDFSIRISPEDIDFERQKSTREDAIEGHPAVQYSDAYLETIAVQREIAERLFDFDTILFHGSALAIDGAAYLFTAQSGTGKSTHARLWRDVYGDLVTMVNDDKPFLRVEEDRVMACGSPWNGKHRLGSNIQVPLKAICILERGADNHIQEISAKEALFMLLQQSNRPQDAGKMPKYLELIDRLSQKVRFFRLRCNMDPQAAVTAREGMI